MVIQYRYSDRMTHTCTGVCDHTYTATQTNFKGSD